MKRKLQVARTDDAWTAFNAISKEANADFKNGYIKIIPTKAYQAGLLKAVAYAFL